MFYFSEVGDKIVTNMILGHKYKHNINIKHFISPMQKVDALNLTASPYVTSAVGFPLWLSFDRLLTLTLHRRETSDRNNFTEQAPRNVHMSVCLSVAPPTPC